MILAAFFGGGRLVKPPFRYSTPAPRCSRDSVLRRARADFSKKDGPGTVPKTKQGGQLVQNQS